MAQGRDILIITADKITDTGNVSYRFMYDADKNRELGDMPQKFGQIHMPNPAENSYTFNVFEAGKGLYCGGGFTEHDTPEWEKQMLDALPSCTLLMDAKYLPWWTEITARHGVVFRHHHFNGTLRTS